MRDHLQKNDNGFVVSVWKKSILIVHDFTQMKVQGSFFQDLIVCYDSRDPFTADNLQRKYFHFVGKESSPKNDIGFVVAVWKELINGNYFNDFEKIYVFSDVVAMENILN